jgi:hypothetical protein
VSRRVTGKTAVGAAIARTLARASSALMPVAPPPWPQKEGAPRCPRHAPRRPGDDDWQVSPLGTVQSGGRDRRRGQSRPYLASDESGFVTGAELKLDGGISAM